MKIADNFMEGGIFDKVSNLPTDFYLMSYQDTLELLRMYKEALDTEERFNIIEIRFAESGKENAIFYWDQQFYDADVEANKKYKKKK
ncbi:MAG: hypothetical protein QM763_05355 [Agriterribacter sp.]